LEVLSVFPFKFIQRQKSIAIFATNFCTAPPTFCFPPPSCEGWRLQPLTILSHKLAKSPMRFAKNAIEQSLLQIKLQLPANANGLANIGTWQGQGRKTGSRNRNRNCDCNVDCELKGEESNNHRCV